jgi:tRNA(Glu) U13 pseudouridine synthase TruD
VLVRCVHCADAYAYADRTDLRYAAEFMTRRELLAVEEVLQRDGLALADFSAPVLGCVQLSSFRRRVVLRPRDVALAWLDDDGLATLLPDLQLQFRLPAGAYATCALRELSRRPILWGSERVNGGSEDNSDE